MKLSVVLASLALLNGASALVSKVTSNAYVNSKSLVGIEFTTVHSDTYTSKGEFRIDLPTAEEAKWKLEDCFLAQNYNNVVKRRSDLVKSSLKTDKEDKKKQYIIGSFDIDQIVPRADFRIQCVVHSPKSPIIIDTSSADVSNASAELTFNNTLTSTSIDANYILVREFTSIGKFELSGSGTLEKETSEKDHVFKAKISKISAPFRTVVIDSHGELTFKFDSPSPLCDISGDDIAANVDLITGTTDKIQLTFTAPTTKGKSYKIKCSGVSVAKAIPGYPVLATLVGTDAGVEYTAFGVAEMENNAISASLTIATVFVAAALAFVF